MTLPEIIIWAVVLCIGVPSSWRDPTAAALVMAWGMGQAIYLVTGDNLPVSFYLFPDLFVMAVIAAKARQSRADWIVLAIFPVMWVFYAADISAFAKWYALWTLAIFQFLAVGVEAFHSFLRGADAMNKTPDAPGSLLVAYRGAGEYG